MYKPFKLSSFLASALISGTFIALFSNLPLVNLCNCLLCLWVWAGSLLGVFLYSKFNKASGSVSLLHGMLLGLLGGGIAAVIGTGIAAILGPLNAQAMLEMIEATPELAEPLAPYTDMLQAGGAALAIVFVIDLLLYSIFGLLGGLLGAAIFKDRKPLASSEVLPSQ